MQRAVIDVDDRGEVERSGELGGYTHGVRGRRGTELAKRHVERFTGDEILNEVRPLAAQSRGNRRHDSWIGQRRRDDPVELGNQLIRAVRRQIEREHLDRDDAIAVRIDGAIDGTQCARADLMDNTKRTECVRSGAGCVRVQRRTPQGKADSRIVTQRCADSRDRLLDSPRNPLRQYGFLVQVNSSEPSVRIPVDVRRFPWIRRLAADYAYDFTAVAPFFSGNPADRTSWSNAIARAQAYARPAG